ncbi:hypothetical protein BDA96_04G270600 [Sorghum bicolor]|uniref:Uncharacterized protein n=2 Tax=Sorghum bicolor TaxID=4558 RepID=A0A921R8S3_SORBI|nr:SH3-containing GRB2-like protein 3-interacting protein 1 [Sorghum bicolor]KAG0534330.1 hypothetical protein BDA96_04G270600 [Sorghum bicolor]|eukprot:XP_021315828.1 SH3-containing GRB2-like protein 3-interacting protein 1 [Sorghum bicolor]
MKLSHPVELPSARAAHSPPPPPPRPRHCLSSSFPARQPHRGGSGSGVSLLDMQSAAALRPCPARQLVSRNPRPPPPPPGPPATSVVRRGRGCCGGPSAEEGGGLMKTRAVARLALRPMVYFNIYKKQNTRMKEERNSLRMIMGQ